jgi:sigma-70-like protein
MHVCGDCGGTMAKDNSRRCLHCKAYRLPVQHAGASQRSRPGARQSAAQRREAVAERDAALLALHADGALTLQQVGDHFGLSRERVRQILKAHGVDVRTCSTAKRQFERQAQRFFGAVAYAARQESLL